MARFLRLALVIRRLVALLVSITVLAYSAQAAEVYVPDALSEWQDWVLADKEYRSCPFLFDRAASSPADFVCAWPGTLRLSVERAGATFSQTWDVSAGDAWVPLPGNTAYWPDAVAVDGKAAAVVLHDGVPSLRLSPGRYRINGRFEWDQRPGNLPVPPAGGLIALTVDGQLVARPLIDRNGIFLGDRERQSQAQDQVTAQVYRLVIDDVPTLLVSNLQLNVSGAVREELFGPLLPEGFIPVSIQSALPARLEADGQLRVQVRPGRWEVSLTARAAAVLDEVPLPTAETNLPDSEIWSYQSNDKLRVTSPEGLTPVDPRQVQVPGAWSQLAAFRIGPGESLRINERSRGQVAADNDLNLVRKLWLDFSGDGFLLRDHIEGSMRRDWRLDMQQPFELLSAEEGGDDLLITRGASATTTGVELRRSDLDIMALARSETRGAMPVTGWDARFTNVSTMLYLPPGNKLLLAPGADTAEGSWIGKWRLLDFFLVLIITISAARLFGRAGGVVAFFAIVLSFHEAGSPAWLWLNLLVAVALLKVAPVGRLHTVVKSYLGLSALILVVALVPFVAQQLRIAIYPQLEAQYWPGMSGSSLTAYDLRAPAAAPSVDMLEDELLENKARAERSVQKTMSRVPMEEIVVTGAAKPSSFERYAPNAIVQAGAGIPSWEWNPYRLGWSGPVDAGQSMRLVILPRWAVSLFRFVEVAMLLWFAAVIAASVVNRQWRLPGGFTLGRATSAAACAVLAVSLLMSPNAQAEVPGPELLQELQNRLLQPPDCVPRCAEISSATVTVNDAEVRIQMTVDALETVAVPLPGSARGWRPELVVVDGSTDAAIVRGNDQLLWLRLAAGRHNVTLGGATTTADSIEIAFPAPPRVIRASSDGWLIAGIKDRQLLAGSLQLTRLQSAADDEGVVRWESSRFPAFVHVSRTVELGLDWRVTTTVQRIAPAQGALSLRLPLLPGESVLTDSMNVSDGRALVSMNPAQASVTWQSTLPRQSPLTLSAAAGEAWKETWFVNTGSIWHANFSGVPESDAGPSASGIRTAEFHPRGGETLTIEASRPEAVEGSTLAFDNIAMTVAQGARSRTTSLELDYRSTRGAQHLVRLPTDAEVTAVYIDGEVEPLRAQDGELVIPILPGEHDVEIEWREEGEVGFATRTPQVDIAAPASNIKLTVDLPKNRWLLLTRGPSLGPAVLYWSELAVLVLFAALLARIGWTPLRFHHWLLLGLGFSTFSWSVLAWVVVWLVAVSARDKWRVAGPWWLYNLMQVGVVAVTVIAMFLIVTQLPQGLLGTPDMHVIGNGSWGNHLIWFADRATAALPEAVALSLPMWVYKVLILAWALWLSLALLKWLPWTWQCFARDGFFRSRTQANDESPA